MIIDGRQIAEEIIAALKPRVAHLAAAGKLKKLAVLTIGDNLVTEKFIKQKQRVAENLSVQIDIHRLSVEINQAEADKRLKLLAKSNAYGGIIIQLPLPETLSLDDLLKLLPPEKDIDALRPDAPVESPVVEAVAEVLKRGQVDLGDKKVLVVGRGRLVGEPVIAWLKAEGINPILADITTTDLASLTKSADIIISGTGRPGLVTAAMVKSGAALIDVGTSEVAGQIAGDIDPTAAEKATLFTPVPGGVGPITVAMLFQNFIELLEQ